MNKGKRNIDKYRKEMEQRVSLVLESMIQGLSHVYLDYELCPELFVGKQASEVLTLMKSLFCWNFPSSFWD